MINPYKLFRESYSEGLQLDPDLSVSEFKDSILDVLAKAPTTKKIVSSPEAKASIGDLREQLENATDPRQKYLLAKQIKSLR